MKDEEGKAGHKLGGEGGGGRGLRHGHCGQLLSVAGGPLLHKAAESHVGVY